MVFLVCVLVVVVFCLFVSGLFCLCARFFPFVLVFVYGIGLFPQQASVVQKSHFMSENCKSFADVRFLQEKKLSNVLLLCLIQLVALAASEVPCFSNVLTIL